MELSLIAKLLIIGGALFLAGIVHLIIMIVRKTEYYWYPASLFWMIFGLGFIRLAGIFQDN